MIKLYLKVIKCFNLFYSIKILFILFKIHLNKFFNVEDDLNSISSIKLKFKNHNKIFFISNKYVGDINIIVDLYLIIRNLSNHISKYEFNDLVDVGSYKGYTSFFLKEITKNKGNILNIEANSRFNNISSKNLYPYKFKIINKIVFIKNSSNVKEIITNSRNTVQYSSSGKIIKDQDKKIKFLDFLNKYKIKKKSILKFSVPELNKDLYENLFILDFFDLIIIQLRREDQDLANALKKDFFHIETKFLIYDIFIRC